MFTISGTSGVVAPPGFRDKRLDLELVVVRDERERFDLGEPLAAEHRRVQIGQLASGHVQLGLIDGVANVYAITFFAVEKPPTDPRSPTTRSAGQVGVPAPQLRGSRYSPAFAALLHGEHQRRPSDVHSGAPCRLSMPRPEFPPVRYRPH